MRDVSVLKSTIGMRYRDLLKFPLDPFPYPPDPRSQPLQQLLPDGNYVYVRDESGTVVVLPDGPHQHPKVLGNARPALYAGDLVLRDGEIDSLTNLSGTFQFDDPEGLRAVAKCCTEVGFLIRSQSVRFFDPITGHCSILE